MYGILQLIFRESLRNIKSSLGVRAAKLNHLGIRGNVCRNNLPNAHATHNWRIYASVAERSIGPLAACMADLCRCHWQVEIYFKWIRQHLRTKARIGISERVVKTQVWVAIVKKRLNLPRSLHENLRTLSLSLRANAFG
jgi:hypothetical protein